MVVCALSLDLALPGARSLKDKRAVLRSLMDKVRHDFRVSVAEVGDNDLWGNATVGVGLVSGDRAFGDAVLRKVLDVFLCHPEIEVRGSYMDVFEL